MSKLVEKELREIEKFAVKLKKNFKRADLDYTIQVAIDSTKPRKVTYAMQMTPPANGLAPVTFIAESSAELIAQIKVSLNHMDYNAVEIAWHKAQIKACESTKLGHEERIKELEDENTQNDEEDNKTNQ